MNILNKKTITIKNSVSKNLALRDSADGFFDYVESFKQKEIIIDFKDVASISRSFAQEYLYRKERSDKNIIEKKLPDNIEKMFDLVKNSTSKPQIVNLESLKPIIV